MSSWAGTWLPYIAGYLFSVVGGHFAAQAVVRPLYGKTHRARLPVAVLGCVERILYTSSVLIGVPALIGFWLALKVVGSWRHLESPYPIAARDLINTFLAGNAMSIMYGYVGGAAIIWCQAQRWGGHVPTVPLALIAGTLVLWVILRWFTAE